VTRHTLSFGNDSDSLGLYLMERHEEGSEMTKVRELVGRFDRWTIEVFNPQRPLGRY
jgi:hypothetical protein